MIVCIDVHYSDETATAAAIVFSDWNDEAPIAERVRSGPIAAPYVPGQLYLRELPPIIDILSKIDSYPIDCVIIDGNVWLDENHRPGLGAHLYQAMLERDNCDAKTTVIGVAKNHFFTAPNLAKINRGSSQRPLYVTSVGIDLEIAADRIHAMAGDFRIPDLLKRADSLCREYVEPMAG